MSGSSVLPALYRNEGGALRVLHVIASMAPEAGGPPAVCAGLADALAARGHGVTIACVKNEGEGQVGVGPKVEVKSFAGDGDERYLKSRGLEEWLRESVAGFDIVHLHSVWQFPTFAAARACWSARKPYVVLLNGMLDRYAVEQHSRWLKRIYWMWREKRVEGRAAGIQFLNEAEIRRAVPWMGGMRKFVIGNGIGKGELERLPARGGFRGKHGEIGERAMALFLSRVHPKKGLDRLIPAWKGFAAKRPEMRLVIAGTGDAEYVAGIERLIEANGLKEKVVMVGQLVGERKWEALVDADVFVLPSHQEGFSMAITEALGAGLPAVVTEECNFDELEAREGRGACGLIVRNGDMVKFTEEVGRLMDDAEGRRRMGAVGAELIRERYTWEKIAGDVERVYRWVLAGRELGVAGEEVWRNEDIRMTNDG